MVKILEKIDEEVENKEYRKNQKYTKVVKEKKQENHKLKGKIVYGENVLTFK